MTASRIAIGGGFSGFSGVEVAGQIADLLHAGVRYYPRLSRDECRVVVVHEQSRILPEVPESLAAFARERMGRRGIEFRLECRAHALDEHGVELATRRKMPGAEVANGECGRLGTWRTTAACTTIASAGTGTNARTRMRGRAVLRACLFALALALSPVTAARTIESYASVLDDATLEVSNKRIRLHGIHVPETGQTCQTFLRPPRCAPRAALALRFKIQGFVRCETVQRYRDGSYSAVCYDDDDVDLGAYLISRGWAVAAPGAPFDYTVRERIARERGFGVWGFNADLITRPE